MIAGFHLHTRVQDEPARKRRPARSSAGANTGADEGIVGKANRPSRNPLFPIHDGSVILDRGTGAARLAPKIHLRQFRGIT